MVDASGDILTREAAQARERGELTRAALSDGEQDGEPAMHQAGAADQVYMIEESQRAGSYMPIEEDEHGTYCLLYTSRCV